MEKFLCCCRLEKSLTAVHFLIVLQIIWSIICISSRRIAASVYMHGNMFDETVEQVLMQVAMIFISVVHYLCVAYLRSTTVCPFTRFRQVFKVSCVFYTVIGFV